MVLPNDARFLNSKKHNFCLYYVYYWFQDKIMHDGMVDLIKSGTHYREEFWNAALVVHHLTFYLS